MSTTQALRVIEAGYGRRETRSWCWTRPEHDVTVEMLGRVVLGQRELAEHALAAPALSDAGRGLLEDKATKTS